MKNSFLLIALSVSLVGFTQELNPVFEDTIFTGNRLQISSFNYYSSNFATNEFTDKFLFGGTITTEIKDRVTNRLGQTNRIGGEAEQRIDNYNGDLLPFKGDKYGLVISLSDNHLISSNIASDLFHTAFYGNADALNDTMDFRFSHVLYQHYLKFGVGFFNKSTLSSIQFNYISGSKGLEGRLNDSWLLSNTDSIQLMFQGAGFNSPATAQYWGFQGAGFAVDLNYNFQFDSKNGYNQVLNLKVSNLGFMVWNPQTTHYEVDSLSKYTGFDIQDFINSDTDPVYNFEDTLGISTRQGKHISAMPIEFAIQKLPLRHSMQKLQYLAGIKTILTADYFPYLYAGLYYAPLNSFSASTRLSYGGFGGLQWGINLNYWIKDKAYLAVGTFDAIGLASKKFGSGRSVNFTAHFNL